MTYLCSDEVGLPLLLFEKCLTVNLQKAIRKSGL